MTPFYLLITTKPMSWMVFLSLLFFAFTEYVLSRTGGIYWVQFILLFFGVLVAYAAYFLKGSTTPLEKLSQRTDLICSIVLLVGVLRWQQHPFVRHAQSGADQNLLSYTLSLTLLLSLIYAAKPRAFLAVTIALLAMAARILTLRLSPDPPIDVFANTSLAVQYLLQGLNPYLQHYPDIYQGASGYPSGFFYPPGVLYLTTPFYLIFRDVRWAYLVADFVVAGLLYRISTRRGWKSTTAQTLALIWITNPVSLYLLESGWTETLISALTAALAFCFLEDAWLLGSLIGGGLLLTKQYTPLLIFLAVIISTRQKSGARSVQWILGTLGVALVGCLPFLFPDPRLFIQSVFVSLTEQPPRPDSFSLPAVFMKELRKPYEGGNYHLATVAILIALAYWLWKKCSPEWQNWAGISAISYGAVFMLGKQAFGNYYQFMAFLILLSVALTPPISVAK